MTEDRHARRFIAELVHDGAAPRLRDAFRPAAPLVRAALPAPLPPAGSLLEARARADRADAHGHAWDAELVAAPGTALASVYRIAIAHDLDPCFGPTAEDEVQALCAAPGLEDPALEDLRALPFVTIDDAHTRDLDQAVFVERDGVGFIVWYALADASHYVRPGSALFTEALARGASYYLPGLVVPMLPRALSEGLISLNEGADRRAFVFRMPLDGAARPTGTTLLRGRIRSRAKLSFQQVQAFYDASPPAPLPDATVGSSLELLREVGELRLRLAEQRHVVHYRRTEVDVGLAADDALRFVAVAEARGPVEQYNEQISLLCNMEGARLLLRADRPDDGVEPVYRVHPRPEPSAVAAFEQLTLALAASRGLDPARWAWRRDRGPSLSQYLAALPLAGAAGRMARAIHRQAVLLNVRSSFSAEVGEHYGVGAEAYARFSSPMREVVGIFVHKEAWEQHRAGLDQPPPGSSVSHRHAEPADEELRAQVIESANRAKELQSRITKEANLLVIDQWFGDDLDRPPPRRLQHRGTVLGLSRGKVHVLLDEPPLEVKVYSRHLEAQLGTELELDGTATSLRRADDSSVVCSVGDAVLLRAVGRDRRDRLELELATDPHSSLPPVA